MTYKLSLGLKREEIIHDLKLVREGIIDADSYQKADTGIILSNLDDIIEMCEEAKDIPAVAPVKHGHWEFDENGNCFCSNCHYEYAQQYDEFCAHCGFDMDEVIE